MIWKQEFIGEFNDVGEIQNVWRDRGRGLPPRLSDLLFVWLREKIGEGHEINIIPVMKNFEDGYSVRVDGVLIGWVDDLKCVFELASGESLRRGEVARRHVEVPAADPKFFDEIWARMMLIDKDCVEANGYSITEKR